MQLQGRRVLITGASRGIGRALAKAFAGAEAKVALVARSEGPLHELASELGGTAHAADLLDPEQVATLLHRVEDAGGPVDVLVNNAGIGTPGAFMEHTAGEVEATIRLNLTTPLELCRQAVPRMSRRGSGHLVTVGSLAAVAYVPGMVTYAATKAGVVHFSEALRDELRGLPINVTTVLVGPVLTDLLAEGETYRPLHAGFQRLRWTQLLPDTDADALAAAVVAGVEGDRKVVFLPKRAAPFVAAAWFPRRFIERWLVGVPRRA
jgi:short-subunit dehydrogenase